MKAHYDKVILIRDEKGQIVGVVVNEPEREHRKTFYAISEMGMDSILQLLSPGINPMQEIT